MAGDAVLVFIKVAVFLVVAIALLWLTAKALGYVASLFEGERLIATIRADVASTRRELRRLRAPGRRKDRVPTTG